MNPLRLVTGFAVFAMTLAAVLIPQDLSAQERRVIDNDGKPFRIYMVTWRGETDTDRGFADYFAERNISVELIRRDANRDSSKFPEFVSEINALKPDLVYTWGTGVSLAILGKEAEVDPEKHVTGIPAVFANVSQPIGSGLVTSARTSGRNITGSFFLVPEEAQLKAMAQYRPFNKLAVLYNRKESNSRLAVDALKDLSKRMAFEIMALAAPLDDQGEAIKESVSGMVEQAAAWKPDFIYIPPDSFMSRHRHHLSRAALQYGVPVFGAAEGSLDQEEDKPSHVLMGLISRYYNIGRLTGHQAERILVNRQRPEDIPIEYLSRFSLVLNMNVADALGLYPPMDILKIAEIAESAEDAKQFVPVAGGS
ncbi:MAG: ABC transporter substrate-binding protein [Rhodospirillales bacterium]